MDNWKKLFRPIILERGLDYYEMGAVTHVTAVENGFHAFVEGTRDYKVRIEIKEGEVRSLWCSCPYAEDGNYCKHMAAVLYEIEQNEDSDCTGEEETLAVSGQELKEVIQKIPEEEVRKLLLELAEADDHLKNRIFMQYIKEVSERQMLRLKKELEHITYRYADRYGFVAWGAVYDYACAVENFLDENVNMLIEKGCLTEAFELTNTVFITVGNQDMDDSNGEMGQLANDCYAYWEAILENCNEAEKEQMFAWFEKNESAGIVIDYMEDYIRDFLMNEFHDEDFLKKKLVMLDKQIEKAEKRKAEKNSWSIDYEYQNNILKRIEIMEELHYPAEEIHNYKKKNWKLAAVRKLQISELLNKNKLTEAVEILQESKQMDKNSPGWVAEYSEKLIELYQKLHMEEKYKDELLFLIFQCGQASLNLAGKLKEICQKEEWEEYREQLLKGKAGWSIRYSLMEKEGLYERLLEEIIASGSVYNLDYYETVLKEKFPERVRDLYIAYVKNQAERASDRSNYKILTSYLKKIEKYPDGKKAACDIAGEWQNVYRRRPAMMDELKKAGF